MKQFKWTYYSFLGLLMSTLVSSYLSLLFLCILILVWLRGGDFKMKLDFLLRNWHYPAMALVMLVLFWMFIPQKLTFEYGLALFFLVAAPLIIPTLKSLNFTYNKRAFSQFFVWSTLVTAIVIPIIFICAEAFNWNFFYSEMDSDSFRFKFETDFFAHFRSVIYYLILLTASILIAEFFNLKDSKRKNAWKIVQLTLWFLILLLSLPFYPIYLPFILVFSAYGIKRYLQKGDPTQKLAWLWLGLAMFLFLFDQSRYFLFPQLSGKSSYLDIFICSENNCFKTLLFLLLPTVFMMIHAYKRKNFPFLIWLISVFVIIWPYAQYSIYEVLSMPSIIFLSLFLPFMNMLKGEDSKK